MPEFKQGVALAYCDSPGAARGRSEDALRGLADPGVMDARADRFLPARIQLALDPQPHGARGHARPLSTARACEQVSVAPARGAGFRSRSSKAGRCTPRDSWSTPATCDGDPLMRLVQLKWYLRTIVNALLDQAVHVDGMSRAAAMKLMTESGFQEEREAAGKWTRAQLTSAQLPVYFVGAQEHFALRAEAAAARRRGVQSEGVSRQAVVVRVAAGAVRARAAVRPSDRVVRARRGAAGLAAAACLPPAFLAWNCVAMPCAFALIFLSQLRAQANSMPRMPRPAGMHDECRARAARS